MEVDLGRGQSPLPSIMKFKNTRILTETFYAHKNAERM